MNTKSKITIVSFFLAIEVVLYALFLAEDFGSVSVGENVVLKYSTIVLAFSLSIGLFLFSKKDDRATLFDNVLLTLGLCLTLVSDLFLLVKGEHYEVGLVTFIGAQLCYFARIKRGRIWLCISIAVRVLASFILIAIFAKYGALYALVSIYFVQLVVNCLENFVVAMISKDSAERTRAIVLFAGFLLFIGCDICVGLFNMHGEAGELIWLFYTPSQVLIALSNRRLYEN